MTDREIQIAEMSQQLTTAYEQSAACTRQIQLCKNQTNNTEIVMTEVMKNNNKMYRSVGRMFVMAEPAQLKRDLQGDLYKIKGESTRSEEMQKNFEAKKEQLTK